MWHKGEKIIPGTNVIASWEVKSYDEGSEFGINNGRISKLTIRYNGIIVLNYDRGWDIRPNKKNTTLMNIYNEILKEYN